MAATGYRNTQCFFGSQSDTNSDLQLRTVPRKRNWSNMYDELKEYVSQHGDALVPSNYNPNPALGHWVTSQRQQYKQFQIKGSTSSVITPERIVKLEALGFVWDALEMAWMDRYQELVQYKHEHGDCLVPREYASNPALGLWVNKQRQEYQRYVENKPSHITPERIQQLNDIEFVWDAFEEAWMDRYQELIRYRNEHGDFLVPQVYASNPTLGKWVSNQRQAYQRYLDNKPSQITPERIQQLNDIDFLWEPLEYKWNLQYQELIRYRNEHGDFLVPTVYTPNPTLRTWVNKQRQQYQRYLENKPSTITPERIQQLNDIDFVWEPLEVAWMDRYQGLIQYKHDHGDCLVPQVYASYPALGEWVQTQRKEYRKRLQNKPSTITPERIKQLNDIDFIWDALEYKWNLQYQELKDFVEMNGHANPTRKNCGNKSLVQWMKAQRYQYRVWRESGGTKKVALTEERQKKLESVGIVLVESIDKKLEWK
eukprot:12338723-Ditylum_brightwellii.AAC.1